MANRYFVSMMAFGGLAFLAWAQPHTALAALQGNVKLEQISPGELGVWTLYTESGTTRTSKDEGIDPRAFTFGISEMGQMTLSIKPAAGMSAKVSMYRGGDLQWSKETQQESFRLLPNDNYRFVIQYSLTKLGRLGITSDPSGLSFRLKGPTRRRYSGRTPKTLVNLPAGLYTIYVGGGRGCTQPAPQSVVVEDGATRTTKHITVNCNIAKDETIERVRRSKRDIVNETYLREALREAERNK